MTIGPVRPLNPYPYVADGSFVAGAIAFSLALNYKQMSLYYALPFFFFILGAALRCPSWYA